MAQPPEAARDGDMRIEPALVRELAQLLTDNALTEIEVQDGERRIKVSRTFPQAIGAQPPAAAAAPAASAPAPAAAAEEIRGNAETSPMVGPAFLSPEPEAKPSIEAGNGVKARD